MITSNIDINDRLVNGLVGRVTQLMYSNNLVSVVYVKFNDDSANLGNEIRCKSSTISLGTNKES